MTEEVPFLPLPANVPYAKSKHPTRHMEDMKMIIDPDFLDHWKTRMLVTELGDEQAPLYLIRLWAHCQMRRDDIFDMPAEGIKALCRYPGDARRLCEALEAAGFITSDGNQRKINKWREKNAALFSAWKNGQRGGRPTKESTQNNPNETHGKPMGNPSVTHGKPMANPSLTHGKPIANPSSLIYSPGSVCAGDLESAFETFWTEYPEKRGKAPAKIAYKKALARLEKTMDSESAREKLKNAAIDYATYLKAQPNPPKPKYAQGWLNDERYEDDFTVTIPSVADRDPRGNLALLGDDVLDALRGGYQPPKKRVPVWMKSMQPTETPEPPKTFSQQKLENTLEAVKNWKPPTNEE
jgi:hypothetical protein